MAKNRIEELAEGFKDIVGISDNVRNSLNQINEAVLSSGRSLDAMETTVKNLGSSLESLGSGFGTIVGVIPGLGSAGRALDQLGGAASGLTDIAGSLGSAFLNVVRAGDEFTRVNRDMAAANFMLAAQFGQTMEEATRFRDFMLSNAEALSGADFGFQDFATETQPMVEALSKNRISFERMQETVQTASGAMDLYSMSVLQATALGVSIDDYARMMSNAMIDQGLTAQEAAEQLALYGDIAERTGLTISTVADSLTGLGDNFRRMGLDADFGQSFLDGFVESLDETGIAIENAADLARTFGAAMANLSTDYSASFVTAQRGGLDMGSGGALGAGIQMQARLMDPNANQAELGRDIAMAVRDTIASFTGGDIVTVQEAAQSRDPQMEQAFVIQTRLLERMYGISDATDQARTLELLQQMAEVQAVGDEQAMANLGEQLQGALNMRRETLSNEDKANRLMTAQLAELNLQTQILGNLVQAVNEEEIVNRGVGMAAGGFDALEEVLSRNEENFRDSFNNYVRNREINVLGEGDQLLKRLSQANMPEGAEATNRNQTTGIASGLASALSNATLSFNTTSITEALNVLGDRIENALNKRSTGGGGTDLTGAGKGMRAGDQ